MGNCSNCIPSTEPEESINSTLKITSDIIIGQYTQIAPISNLCCYKANTYTNFNLIYI